MADELDAVRQAVKTLEDTWNTNEMHRMAALWDQDDPTPFYLAEEEPVPAIGWDAVHDYWRRTQALNERINVEVSDLNVKLTGADSAIALYMLFWQIKLTRYPKALAGKTRVVAVYRRKPDGWKLVTYVEGALSPITYLREMYEERVRPGF